MAEHIKPYDSSSDNKKAQVEDMFDNIAHRYDFLNHLLSLGIDQSWRRKAIRWLNQHHSVEGQQVMDMATGTGDFAIDLAKRTENVSIVALDLSEQMLSKGRQKSSKQRLDHRITWVKGDAESLPYEDNTFSAMTVGFGVRNFGDIRQGLREMHRILKPGAPLIVLEVSQPKKFPMRQIFGVYFRGILPFVGRVFSKDHRAYTYLPESVKAFPEGEDFIALLHEAGFHNGNHRALTAGICAMYTCTK
ncbi:MAG: bifunctional demethylmenaquinone methyltransferase/2-methoxy-6-polyprenyl-1,4-benzoquinol methylase UbiE [Chitinophagales bacterium]